MSSDAMYVFGTGSSHTVCQMPVVGVYQMPCGLRICLPRGWYEPSVGSLTLMTSSCSSIGFNALKMSKLNGS